MKTPLVLAFTAAMAMENGMGCERRQKTPFADSSVALSPVPTASVGVSDCPSQVEVEGSCVPVDYSVTNDCKELRDIMEASSYAFESCLGKLEKEVQCTPPTLDGKIVLLEAKGLAQKSLMPGIKAQMRYESIGCKRSLAQGLIDDVSRKRVQVREIEEKINAKVKEATQH